MLSHAQIWASIDALAEKYGLTPSGLARQAGLDSTTFNRSKRMASDGRLRWPSTESIAKALDTTGEDLDAFMDLVVRNEQAARSELTFPMISFANLSQGESVDEKGYPTGALWEEVALPSPKNNTFYAVEMSDDSYHPVYRKGDRLIISMGAQLKRGDRVLMKLQDKKVALYEIKKTTRQILDLMGLVSPLTTIQVQKDHIAWTARIIWVSQ